MIYVQRFLALCASLCLGALHAASPDSLALKRISRDLGLPSPTVRAIAQDPQGLMWLGMESGGLARYDGSSFHSYRHNEHDEGSISSNYVNVLLFDRSGTLWIGTENGLNRYDPRNDRFERFMPADNAEGLGGQIVLDLLEDAHGYLWVATEGGASRKAPDSNTFERILAPPPGSNGAGATHQCNKLFRDRSGRIWLATRLGMLTYDARAGALAAPDFIDLSARGVRSKEFFAIAQDLQGNLWFGHQTGLGYYDPINRVYREISLSPQTASPTETNVSDLLIDRRGDIWVGTFSEGLRIIDPDTMEIRSFRSEARHAHGLRSDSIRDLFQDRNGLIWIGTKFEGLFLYDNLVETFPSYAGLPPDPNGHERAHILALQPDPDGALWIGTKQHGLVSFDPESGLYGKRFSTNGEADRILDNRIEALLHDGTHLWLGTERGLSRLEKETDQFVNFSGHIVRAILKLDQRRLLVGTNYGLQFFDTFDETFEAFPALGGIDLSTESAKEIKAIARDSAGIIYVGTHHSGLYAYDPAAQSLQAFLPQAEAPESIPGEMIRSIFECSRGYLWIGLRLRGLSRLDRETGLFTSFTTAHGLPSNSVFGIQEDDTGMLWLTTDAGLARFDPEAEAAIAFNENYGLQSDIFEPNAIAKGADGRIFIGGESGFNAFFPSQVSKRSIDAHLVISSLTVFEQPLPLNAQSGTPIRLPHDRNYLSIAFALTDYSSPGQNEYAYMLEGLDEQWIHSRRRNFTTYTSLAPGSYRFLLRGRSPSSEWRELAQPISIVIAPPLWKTVEFMVAVVATTAFLVFALYLYLTKRQRRRRAQLEAMVNQRTAQLRQANEVLLRQSERITLQNTELGNRKLTLEKMVFERTQDLELAKRKAEESDRLKSSFLANMSHEIRTPMNAIIGFSNMLCLEGCSDEERKEFARIINNNCGNLLHLVDDILDISIIESGQLRMEPQVFDLHELLLELASIFRSQLLERNQEHIAFKLDHDIENTSCFIECDPDRLKQILVNLIGNAIKFTQRGHVSVRYRKHPDTETISFDVEDTGIGIDAKNLDAIWERFRKIEDDTQRLFRGSGLGLAITKNLVELLGGNITVQSRLGHGTTFTFTLPCPAIDQDQFPRLQPPAEAVRGGFNQAARFPKALNILLAEDEDSNAELIHQMLRDEPCRIHRARNGEEAIHICHELGEELDLVLMDIKLPVVDGKAAARSIKQSFPLLPLIAQTAYASESEKEEIMAAGFDHYLTKPIAKQDLLGALQAAMAQG